MSFARGVQKLGPEVLPRKSSARADISSRRATLLVVAGDLRFDAATGSPRHKVDTDLARLLAAVRGVRHLDLERVRRDLHRNASRAPQVIAQVENGLGVADSDSHGRRVRGFKIPVHGPAPVGCAGLDA